MTAEQLIAALEAADGARYVLDQAIAKLVLPADILARVVPPPYTASIDAALTLVPEGLRWRVSGVPAADKAFASCATGSIMDPATKEWDGIHATPAIALCTAALKARGDAA